MRLAALLVLLAGCGVSKTAPDMGNSVAEWDGHCYGRPGDNGQRVIWLRKVYVCRDNGPPNHWWFVQDPVLDGMEPLP